MIKKQMSLDEYIPIVFIVKENIMLYLNGDISESIRESLEFIFRNYAYSECNFLPIYTSEIISDELYHRIIANKITSHLDKYIFLFNEMYTETISRSKTPDKVTYNDSDKRTLNITDTKTGTNTRIDDDVDVNKSMNEISPIDANIDNITTPNNKTYIKTETDKSRTDNINETMTNSGTDNLDKSGSRSDPSIFKEFIELMEKYNIRNILDRICRSVIAEFNTSI